MAPLFPALASAAGSADAARTAIRFGDRAVSYRDLATASARLAAELGSASRVAVWATPELTTCVAVVGALAAGVPAVPVNPKVGERELAHILSDSMPDLVLAGPDEQLPAGMAEVRRVDVHLGELAGGGTASPPDEPDEPAQDAPALIVYTSGTTGPPKGVVLPRRAISSNLDTLATAWEWTADDVLVHGLPLFHVHGLVLGVLGPLRLGGTVHHLGRFSPAGAAAALDEAATMMFGVPTMYHRLAEEVERSAAVAAALGRARLLVSGSAALPATLHERISRATGQRVVERYGMTETLMSCGVRCSGDRRPGYVGPPLDGVEVRLVDEDGSIITGSDDETVGEIHVRGPSLFTEYLNRPDATASSMRDGWFVTGDMATRAADGYLRIAGRKATDLIKSGGFKIGAAEIENVLLDHPAVAEVAVTGEPDADLGERVVA
jgi:malonyl-CoA/methylmalonyl-CoA synthetase